MSQEEEEKEVGNSSVLAISAGTWAIFELTVRTQEKEEDKEEEELRRSTLEEAKEEQEEHCTDLEEDKEEEEHSTNLRRCLRPRVVTML